MTATSVVGINPRDLLRTEAYPHHPGSVHMAETHVSWLFFTGDYVYKVKKPVDFGFLDFTTLDKRLHFCETEVELNSRLSPDVYLGVVPICQTSDGLRAGGDGKPVDYAVKMRQLPEHRSLKTLLEEGSVGRDDAAQVARKIAVFHTSSATGEYVTSHGDIDAVRENVAENFDQLRPYIGSVIIQDAFDDLRAYSEAFLEARAEVFRRREREGRIRDGHGDLHAANIFLDDDIHVIDCIEFNDRFRCLDVAEDVAFLAMDLDHHGRRDLSEAFVMAYVDASGDDGLRDLLAFFKVYRAIVRAKVACLGMGTTDSLDQKAVSEAESYFNLARQYVMSELFPSPTLVVVCGIMGTGKTSIAETLAARWDLEHISSDVTRKTLAGLDIHQRIENEFGQGLYSPQMTERTYAEMHRQAIERLSKGRSVILDGTYSKAVHRRQVIELAEDMEVKVWFVECVLDEAELRERVRSRWESDDVTSSDGSPDLLESQVASFEALDELSDDTRIVLKTGGSPEEVFARTVRTLFSAALTAQP